MTGTERLQAAVRGEMADRVPVFCNLLDQGAKELGMGLREYYSKGEYVAQGQLAMREKYGYDNLWSLFYVGKEAELLGCRKIIYSDSGPPNVGEMTVRGPSDIARLRIPGRIENEPAFQETIVCLKKLRAEAGGRYPICAYITSSMTLPVLLMGMERWVEMLLTSKLKLRDELLWKCHEFFVKETMAYRTLGADVVLYSNPFGSTDIVSAKMFRELVLPWIERDIQAIGTTGVVYYCGGARTNAVLETVQQRTGIGAYYLAPQDNISAARELLSGQALCCGTINDIKLLHWGCSEIEQEVRRIFDAAGGTERFLFGTLVMPFDIPPANIRCMLEAAYRYGARHVTAGQPV